MHTFIIILIGLALLAISHWVSATQKIRFLRFFPVIWFAISAAHLAMGLNAGYTLEEELKVHAFVFGIPTLVWLGLTQYLKRRNYTI